MISISQIDQEWQKDSKIDPVEIDQESLNVSSLHAKYLSYYRQISQELSKQQKVAKQLKHQKRLYYNGQMNKEEIEEFGWPLNPYEGASKPLKSELDKWVASDEDVLKFESIIDDLELTKDILLKILDNIQWRSNSIKNVIEWRKFIDGQ